MPMPRSVTRRKRNGQIVFIASVEPAKYTLRELTRAALRDSARLLMTRIHREVEKIAKGIPDPGHLILITYNCQDKLRVLKLFQNFGEQRVREVIQAGLEIDYYMQLKSIYEHADSSLLEFSITSLAKEESVLLKFKQMIKS